MKNKYHYLDIFMTRRTKFARFLGKGKILSTFHSFWNQSLIPMNQIIEETIQMAHQTTKIPTFHSDIRKIIRIL